MCIVHCLLVTTSTDIIPFVIIMNGHYKEIHPSIFNILFFLYSGSGDLLEPILAVIDQRQGDTQDK